MIDWINTAKLHSKTVEEFQKYYKENPNTILRIIYTDKSDKSFSLKNLTLDKTFDQTHSRSNTWTRNWGKEIYLNEWFEGCERHHITETIIICMPGKLHRSFKHSLKTGKGMGNVNIAALKYLESSSIVDPFGDSIII